MTDLVALTEYLVKRLVSDPDVISVKEVSNEDNCMTIMVLVAEKDMPILIGKGGATINAIRTIVQASSYINNKERVNINVESLDKVEE